MLLKTVTPGHSHTRDLIRCTAAILATVALNATVVGCGTERSPEAFCEVYQSEKQTYVQKYDDRATEAESAGNDDPLAGALLGVVSSFEALGDAEIFFDKLAKVSPDDIQPDVEKIRDQFKQQTEAMSGAVKDPLGTFLGGLVSGLTTSGSWTRVGEYVTQHCG